MEFVSINRYPRTLGSHSNHWRPPPQAMSPTSKTGAIIVEALPRSMNIPVFLGKHGQQEAAVRQWSMAFVPSNKVTRPHFRVLPCRTVDGSEIRRSPVEVGIFPIIYKALYIQTGGCLGYFFHLSTVATGIALAWKFFSKKKSMGIYM